MALTLALTLTLPTPSPNPNSYPVQVESNIWEWMRHLQFCNIAERTRAELEWQARFNSLPRTGDPGELLAEHRCECPPAVCDPFPLFGVELELLD